MLLKLRLPQSSNPIAPTNVSISPSLRLPAFQLSGASSCTGVLLSSLSSAMTLPTDESRRLETLYSQMTDGELEKIAADAYSLTEVARQAIEAELHRRNLQPGPS